MHLGTTGVGAVGPGGNSCAGGLGGSLLPSSGHQCPHLWSVGRWPPDGRGSWILGCWGGLG